MFDRKKFKTFALEQLKGRWTVPILIVLITWIINGIFSLPEKISMLQSGDLANLLTGDFSSFGDFFDTYFESTAKSSGFITIIIRALIEGILEVAALNVYLRMSRSPEPVNFSYFIEGLNNWWRAIKSALWILLWTFIWSLLFVIPGLIKSISYSMTYYLVVEYENLSITKAMDISKLITNGHKADLFITYLSFIGWILLCTFTFNLASLFLNPYMEMTLINAYHALLQEAIENGKLKPEDLE